MATLVKKSLLQTPLRAVWEVSGYQTETLLWPATSAKAKTILFFIPGNPGLVEYYTSFLQGIYKTLNHPSFEIIGEDQIDHKINCLDVLIKENEPNTHFILMGHSIGSYIAAAVLKKRPNHRISRVIALFPTLREIAITPNGINITRIVNTIPASLFGFAGTLISSLPPSIRQLIVKMLTGQEGDGLQVTAHQLLYSSVLKNAVTMARFEMETVKALDHDFYTKHLDKFIMYYSANDKWAPKDHYDYMMEHFPDGNIHLCPENVPHAFCLEPKHINYMVTKVASWIQNDM
ncbi:uncharacterized protein BX663DRAFT_489278 [Cokeromyces recurvatus]|uniref:uncharacterized protein n=1 Tax=Cokeromyces recurvatus TaxID=90255 RepID=UPI0022204CE6|nr:uncharacterized protein BX663DRAFT_489278 [Cokeromyces recurvatus]KAI7899391.1 hypothetical protein BX663DRAFT_489278 [Cokeromyces recurvatus]